MPRLKLVESAFFAAQLNTALIAKKAGATSFSIALSQLKKKAKNNNSFHHLYRSSPAQLNTALIAKNAVSTSFSIALSQLSSSSNKEDSGLIA